MKDDQKIGSIRVLSGSLSVLRNWPRWIPYASLAWSLVYAALGLYWAVSGIFPYSSGTGSNSLGPLVGRFGPGLAWAVVVLAGIPAALLGTLMLRAEKSFRRLKITAGAILSATLLLCMADLTILEMLGYIPYAIVGLFTGAGVGQIYLQTLSQVKWILTQQLFCILGGFLWLANTVVFSRASGAACLFCGRREGSEGWSSPVRAAVWGRIAVYVAVVPPLFYAFVRFAWALGFPLGMSLKDWQSGHEKGLWTAGLFLASFGLMGVVLMLGLVQRWGEVFPLWIPALRGRRVPISLAIIPSALVSVVLIVGGLAIWSGLPGMISNSAANGSKGMALVSGTIFQVGPTLLFPLWGAALAFGTLAYYFRRRGVCNVCGRGAASL